MSLSVNRNTIYLYNPWLLKHIYSHLLFSLELVTQWHWYYPSKDDSYEAKKRLIIENIYVEYVIYEIDLLNQSMNKELFPLDIADVNFEWLLYRAVFLFRPIEIDSYPVHLCIGSQSNCELKISNFLESLTKEESHTIYTLLQNYIKKIYITEITQYKDKITQRYAILFNMKHLMENYVKEKFKDTDYVIVYSRELVMTMIYQFFIEEFIGEQKIFINTLIHHHNSSNNNNNENEIKEARKIQNKLESLLCMVKKQYKDEFDGFALMANPSISLEKYRQRAKEQNDHNNLCINPVPVISIVVLKTHKIIITEEETSRYRYIRLKGNYNHYISIARRFQFDYYLRRNHHILECKQELDEKNNNYALKYVKYCSTCHYFGISINFTNFYEQCERTYATIDEHDIDFFNTVIVQMIDSITGLLYLTLYNISLLFKMAHFSISYTEYCQIINCSKNHRKKDVDFLQMVDIQGLFNQIHEQLKTVMIDHAIDLAIITCHPYRNIDKETPEQHLIAVQYALFSQLITAITKQETDIEKYERSLSNHLLSVNAGSSETIHRNVQVTLIQIYNLYRELLCDLLGVKK